MRQGGLRLACVAVIAAAVLTHAGSLDGSFVYDDHRFIEANPHIRTVDPWAALTDASTASHAEGIRPDIYRPLRTILFSIEYALFAGEDARTGAVDFHLGWWHAMSVLLHALNAVLVLRLLLPLLRGAVVPSAAGALVFAVHPVTSESVAWLSSQGDLLAVSLMLTALIVLEKRGLRRTALGALLYLLACLAKESALMLPGLLVLRDVALPRAHATRRSPWARSTGIRAGVLVLVAGHYFALRLGVVEGLAQVGHPLGDPLATVRGMLSGLLWYAQSLLWPSGFSFDARIDVPLSWAEPVVWVGAGFFLTLLAVGIAALRSRRFVLAFSVLGFLVALGPVSNVIVPLKAFVADRFLYPGLVCVAAGIGALLFAVRGRAAPVIRGGTALLLVLLAVLTAARNDHWSDDFALWAAVRHDRPANPNAYQGLAFEYAARRETSLAVRAYAAYLEANPYDGKSLRTLGDLMGRVADDAGTESSATSAQRRRAARREQIRLYEQALQIWDTPWGLEVGRGSERMREEMLEQWIEAGLDLAVGGDVQGLWAARFANDRLIDYEAGERRHEDAEAVWKSASWRRRRVRYAILLTALRMGQEAHGGDAAAKHLEAARRHLVADVGLDPARSDRALLPDLADRLGALIDDGLRRADVRPDRWLYLEHARLLVALGDLRSARATLRRGLEAYRTDPTLLSELDALEKVLRERMGR